MKLKLKPYPENPWSSKTELEEIYGMTDYEFHDACITPEQAQKYREERAEVLNKWRFEKMVITIHNTKVNCNYKLIFWFIFFAVVNLLI